MCAREKEGERMPQCTTNCEYVSLHTVQALVCVCACVCACAHVCVFDLWFPNQTLFCGFFFFFFLFSGIIKVSDSTEGWLSRCIWAILKRIPRSPGCRDMIAIKRQASAREANATQTRLCDTTRGVSLWSWGTEVLVHLRLRVCKLKTITIQLIRILPWKHKVLKIIPWLEPCVEFGAVGVCVCVCVCVCAAVGRRRRRQEAAEGGMNQTGVKKQFVFSLSSDNNATWAPAAHRLFTLTTRSVHTFTLTRAHTHTHVDALCRQHCRQTHTHTDIFQQTYKYGHKHVITTMHGPDSLAPLWHTHTHTHTHTHGWEEAWWRQRGS